jgi:rubrerythrin
MPKIRQPQVKKWVCPICSYEHAGNAPPEICPNCEYEDDDWLEEVAG